MALSRGPSVGARVSTPPAGHAEDETASAAGSNRGRSRTPGSAVGGFRRRPGQRLAPRPWHFVLSVVAVAVVAGATMGPSAFPAALRLPVGREVENAFEVSLQRGAWLYEPVAQVLETSYEWLSFYLTLIPPPVLVVAVVLLIGYRRGVRLALLAVATFAWVILTGLWETTLETIAFVLVVVVISSLVGVAVGLVGAVNSRANAIVRLLLDGMQAFPAFAYLVPIVFLFGIGNTGALIVTVIWAMPPIARMTVVGLRNVSPDVLEAAVSTGAGRWRLLLGVRLPMAAPSIRAGLNQTIMYAVAMATLAAMIGAAGLGRPVWSGLQRLEFGDALEAGIALVLIAILIDRATTPRSAASKRNESSPPVRAGALTRLVRRRSATAMITIIAFLAVVVASQVSPWAWQNFADPPWGTPWKLREPVGAAMLWMTTSWGPSLDAIGSAVQLHGLNPLGDIFGSIPWFLVAICTVSIGIVVAGKVRGVALGVGVVAIGCLGMWTSTAATLSVITSAIVLVLLIGFPLGIVMSASDRFAAVIRPILDVMQTLPVYLFVIPAVMLIGTGEVSAVLATSLAALPPMIRFTNLGLRGVDAEVIEAAVALGATPRQVLRHVRIPLGLPTIMVGLNQAVLLALVMAVVGAMIGAPGLGQDILAPLERLDLARGIEAGFAMFLLAIILDRLFDGSARMLTTITHTPLGSGRAES